MPPADGPNGFHPNTYGEAWTDVGDRHEGSLGRSRMQMFCGTTNMQQCGKQDASSQYFCQDEQVCSAISSYSNSSIMVSVML